MALPRNGQIKERRRFQRARINLTGRYLLRDRHEYPCEVLDISPGSAALIAPVSGKIGERVVAYLECIGRLEGTVTRIFPNGFAMRIAATAHKRDKLAGQLTWLTNRQMFDMRSATLRAACKCD